MFIFNFYRTFVIKKILLSTFLFGLVPMPHVYASQENHEKGDEDVSYFSIIKFTIQRQRALIEEQNKEKDQKEPIGQKRKATSSLDDLFKEFAKKKELFNKELLNVVEQSTETDPFKKKHIKKPPTRR